MRELRGKTQNHKEDCLIVSINQKNRWWHYMNECGKIHSDAHV